MVKIYSNDNSHSLLVGMQTGILEATLGDRQFLTKLNLFLAYDQAITLLGIYQNELKNVCPYKNLHTNIYSSFTNNCQKSEATKIRFSGWMNKTMAQHTVECESVTLKNDLSSCEKTGRELKCILLNERW